eukprot:6222242-Amphidinium_carterae.1
MDLCDLQLFRAMKGKRIECEVASHDVYFLMGATTIIMDSKGDAVCCTIYNLSGVCNQQTADAALPYKSIVVIAEPFFKIMASGDR